MEIGSEEWGSLVVAGAGSLGVALRPEQVQRFARHAAELLRWNSVTNLTAITGAVEIARNHFLDSLAPAPLIPEGSRLLDVGSGGGFPGIPLHVAVKGLETTLLDASRKKTSFLRHAIRALELEDIEALQKRIEDFAAEPGRRGAFRIVVSRAYAALATFVRQALPLLDPRGAVIAYKGSPDAAEMADFLELAAAEGLSFEEKPYGLPGLRMARTLVIVRRAQPERPGRIIRSSRPARPRAAGR